MSRFHDEFNDHSGYENSETRLWRAVAHGDIAGVNKVLAEEKNVRLDCRHKEETLLYFAVRHQDHAIAEILLKAGVDVNAPSGFMKYTPFILACANGDNKAIDLLVKYKADVEARTRDEETGLHRATWNSNIPLIRKLVEELEMDVDAQNYLGQTPLFCAVSTKSAETIKALMQLGGNPNIEGCDGFTNKTPRAFAETVGQRQEVATTLDDPELRAEGLKTFKPVTRKPITVGKPLVFKMKPGNTSFSSLD